MADAFFYPNMNDTLPRKILFLGDENIGKTTLLSTFCGHMRDYYKCDSYKGSFLIFTQFLFYQPRDGIPIPIQLLDLPAGTTEESRRDQYPADVKLIVLCFAVDNPTSFDNVLVTWFPEFRHYYPNYTHYYLLGLRKDTRENPDIKTVPLETAQQIHRQCSFAGEYMECSAVGNIEQVDNLMNILISEAFFNERFINEP